MGPSGPVDRVGQQEDLIGASGVLVAPGIKSQYMDEVILGFEYELLDDLKVGVSYQNRRLGRVIEDVSTDGANTYIIANPGEWSSDEERKLEDRIAKVDGTCQAEGPSSDACDEFARLSNHLELFKGIRIFDKPSRDYNVLQFTLTRRFSKKLYVQGSYTYSKTEGNYGGLYSADNGQVDPNITSQYDLIELLANREGPPPQDRPHYFKLDAYYIWKLDDWFGGNGLGEVTTGGRFRALSGTVQDALARHYLYGFDESFLLPRGEMGRNDVAWGFDSKIAYGRDIGHGMKLEFWTDLYSVEYLFQTEHVAAVDETYTLDNANPVDSQHSSSTATATRSAGSSSGSTTATTSRASCIVTSTPPTSGIPAARFRRRSSPTP